MFGRLGRLFSRPAVAGGAWVFLVAGIVATVLFVGGFTVFADQTNRLEFCISCHEMESGPYAEYTKTIHYNNRTGVRAVCADCHVPKEFVPKLAAKVIAAKDVYHHLAGTIDTKDKFEARRLEMAQRVWATMEASGSRECKTCHNFQAMNLDEQGRRAKKKHPEAMQDGKHCINCHKGIVHELPKGYEGD
ncbi:NapC/NirT family cytochrome c [Azospirillum sp.]|uniref:NapC/NirT family cytochrome c n=1 Tax=Azospirillum sp. TaxID=34012 RepID=UPI002D538A4A|nr:NapC/NirT family cytochrome c [Azospirillum sp.]HYD64132.1 NapC/NirT family cytochrome c [Azospirillum sp.]